MRTSYLQYLTMVEFMEANGDLSKPTGGHRDRHYIQKKWKELTTKLNGDVTGDPRSGEKWRKVWSDYKNNCKKKCTKISKAASRTRGGPSIQLSLTDLEKRVMQIIVQSAAGKDVKEAGSPLDETETLSDKPDEQVCLEVTHSDWNTPGTSVEPTVTPPPLSSPPQFQPKEDPLSPASSNIEDTEEMPPPPKKPKLVKLIMDADRKAREYAREREQVYDELERERLRLKNEELRLRQFEAQERVRQRDIELQLQKQWLDFMKEAMNVLVKYTEKPG